MLDGKSYQEQFPDDPAYAPHYRGGVFAKYMAMVSSASQGAVTVPSL